METILDALKDLIGRIEIQGMYQNSGWHILRRGTVAYKGGRTVYDCIAVKMISPDRTKSNDGR